MIEAIHDSATIEKAKAIYKRFRLYYTLICLGIPFTWLAIYYLHGRLDIFILGIIIFFFVVRLCNQKLYREMIYGALLDQQNAPLFYHLVHQGKQYGESGIIQIQSELFLGNYANVIPACRKKLADGKCFKKYKYAYLTFLAHSYFALGDDGKLREICDWYYQYRATDKKKVKTPKGPTAFDFFNAYLNRDLDTCQQYLSQENTCPAMQTEKDYERARILLLQGDIQAARALFSQIAYTVPMINYGLLAKQAVQSIDAGEPYSAPYANLTENADYAVMPPRKSVRYARILFIASIVFLVLYMVMMIVSRFNPQVQEYYLRKELHSTISKDYGDVDIIETFYLEKNGEIADSMFVAKSEESIIVGCVYWYDNDDTMYYDVQAEKSIASFAYSPYETFYFLCATTDYTAHGFFCGDLSYIPQDACYTLSFALDGKIYYLVIDEVSVPDWFEMNCP